MPLSSIISMLGAGLCFSNHHLLLSFSDCLSRVVRDRSRCIKLMRVAWTIFKIIKFDKPAHVAISFQSSEKSRLRLIEVR
jgi:predicted Na+-dependent transporter